MKKKLVELVFILDRSSSMSGIESDIIGGYNTIIKKQKKIDGEANITTVLFNDKIKVLHTREPIHAMPALTLTEEEYCVQGGSALPDAIGQLMYYITNVYKYEKEDEAAGIVLFVIMADGRENISKEYSFEKIRKMIERQKACYNLKFIFLVANTDAIETAKQYGIDKLCAANFMPDSRGIKVIFRAINKAITDCRMIGKVGIKWKEEIDRDYKQRK
jgi:hypothetical protein